MAEPDENKPVLKATYLPQYNDDGVDMSLIRSCLSLTPLERAAGGGMAATVAEVAGVWPQTSGKHHSTGFLKT